MGMWNKKLPPRMLDAARELKDRGLVRHLAVSTHKRTTVPQFAPDANYDIFHVRYNAKHSGAESDIFPHLSADNRPGIVSFTATSWKMLLRHRRIPKQEKIPTAGDCYRFVLTNPNIDVCMTGPSNLEHTEHALEALRRGPMSDEEMAWMRRVGDALYGKHRA